MDLEQLSEKVEMEIILSNQRALYERLSLLTEIQNDVFSYQSILL